MRRARVVQQYVMTASDGGLKTEYEALSSRKALSDYYEFVPVVLNNCHCGISLSDIRFYRNAIREADPDIVHIRGAGMESLNAVLGAKLSGRGKVLVTVHGILAALLMALTLVTKAIQHNPIGNDYLCFLIMLLLFPCVMRRCEGDVSFYRITIFFACGIITAALTAQQIATFPNISQFIKVDSYLTVTRLSGFYGDPNFYSAHIAACLAGTQLLLCHEKSRRRQIVLAILALVLLYCGLLSASKSFIIVTACLFLLWVPILLEKGTFSSHFRLFVGLLCAGIIIASSSAFRALLQIVDDRFAQASNLSELTTGRTDLWRNYIHEFLNNPITLLFGEGYTSINLNNKASHNTLIQVVYQFGLIGMPLLISWVVISLRNLFTQLNAGHVKWKHALLMCVGVVLPWMGIDILQFDEFFLLPVYAVIGIAYSTRSTENKKLESSKGEI